MNTSNYQDLGCWKKAIELTKIVYSLIRSFPKEELYGLSDQIRRCVVSIPSNIAEGQGRNSDKEFIKFLSYSRGSICELQTQLIISVEVGILHKDSISQAMTLSQEIDRMIAGLIKYLNNRVSG